LSSVENPWLRHLVLHQCERVQFPFWRQLMNEVLPKLWQNPRRNMFSQLLFLYYMYNLFWFWMSCVGYDTFAMVVNFINSFWDPTHVTVGVF
jgi:hypothetical protein